MINENTVDKTVWSCGVVGISTGAFKVRTTVVDPFASFPVDLSSADGISLASTRLTSDITYLT
ncbi:hypothetical protein [Rhodococcoides fascians]|uniref:hypothetical protein n=1 Tax=Rhodococcoides fascians TaxID=1828 RepID=UPI000B1CF849|nr:hypothetical protein [Rhodococcus fascians]